MSTGRYTIPNTADSPLAKKKAVAAVISQTPYLFVDVREGLQQRRAMAIVAGILDISLDLRPRQQQYLPARFARDLLGRPLLFRCRGLAFLGSGDLVLDGLTL